MERQERTALKAPMATYLGLLRRDWINVQQRERAKVGEHGRDRALADRKAVMVAGLTRMPPHRVTRAYSAHRKAM